jgi:hypothetical protein
MRTASLNCGQQSANRALASYQLQRLPAVQVLPQQQQLQQLQRGMSVKAQVLRHYKSVYLCRAIGLM